ncbi:Hypothetical predicted protein [Paramuricea clavata]|uniref:Uncharacterized protein n=1 Tax=Paramuricea clavata TaxID=317549 RepID=A0A7D9DCE4_PARCT|nr:Hypothetical predicted protein [Paramuricea clavata]
MTNCELLAHQKECFGIGGKTPNNITSSNDHDSSYSLEESSGVECAMSMLQFRNILNHASNNGSGLRADDRFFHNEILKYILNGEHKIANEVLQKSELEGTAAQFGMEIVPIAPYGNCFFTAIVFSIVQNISKSNTASRLYENLGIQLYNTMEEVSQTTDNRQVKKKQSSDIFYITSRKTNAMIL